MRQLVAILKLLLFATTLASYFISAGVVTLFITERFARRKMLTRLVARYARFACSFMGIHVYPHGTTTKAATSLFVGNHLSYLDVIVHASLRPSCFITSVEIRETAVLGQICQLAGCVFVERRSRENLSREIIDVSQSLLHGANVTIFPEATSTNGESVLRFKRPLFQAAIDANVPIVPITINYERLDGAEINLSNRDDVFWYGDMSFFPHLWRVLSHRRIDVSVHYHDVIVPEGDTSSLAQQCHDVVHQSFYPIKTRPSYDGFERHGIENPVATNGDA